MSTTYKFINIDEDGSQITQRYSFDPVTECPLCHASLFPDVLLAKGYTDSFFDIERLAVLMRCLKCNDVFIAKYSHFERRFDNQKHCYVSHFHSLDYVGPKSVNPIRFDPEIHEISRAFVEIYNESNHAEQLSLNHIAGPGYRKALEFLIKDYLIHENKDYADEIKKMFLDACINKFVDDHKLKIAASRSAWLGNDHTHYEKRFKDKDINDFKRLIKLTVNWISSSLLTKEVEKIERQK